MGRERMGSETETGGEDGDEGRQRDIFKKKMELELLSNVQQWERKDPGYSSDMTSDGTMHLFCS